MSSRGISIPSLWTLATLLLLGPAVPAAAQTPSLRILTYNTALLTIEADLIDLTLPLPLTFTLDVNDGDWGDLDYAQRAAKIAQLIKQSDQDVVILNEVYSDVAREVLVSELSDNGPFDFFISKIAGLAPTSFTLGDLGGMGVLLPIPNPILPFQSFFLARSGGSGLMIFSKFPFLSVPASAPNDAISFEGINGGFPLTSAHFGFTVFEECEEFDCLSSKGAALVKLDTPGNHPSWVAFTHMQADYDDSFPDVRFSQFAQIKDLLEAGAGSNLSVEPAYILGDFNVKGFNWNNFLDPGNEPEWGTLFHPGLAADDFFACGIGPCFLNPHGSVFSDSWGFGTSVDDPGHTTFSGKRIDYILHNWADRRCMQHAMIAWDLSEEGAWFSDHKPVRADFNLSARWCSPSTEIGSTGALPIVMKTIQCDDDPATSIPDCVEDVAVTASDGARITFPGSFQWFRITEPGSYSILSGADDPSERIAFDVYQAEDLSRPIAPFSNQEHPDYGLPFSLHKPPYYVRVFAADPAVSAPTPDRQASGVDYAIKFHLHDCRSADDACFLPVGGVDVPYSWPQLITPLNEVKDLWFRLRTSGVDGGRLSSVATGHPENKLLLESPTADSLGCLGLKLEEYAGIAPPIFVEGHDVTAIEVDLDSDWDNDTFPDARHVAPELDGENNDFKDYYVRLTRDVDLFQCQLPISSTLRFETSLTFFWPQEIKCAKQIDDTIFAKDNIDFQFQFDGAVCAQQSCPPTQDFDCATQDYLSNEPALRGYYVDNLFLKIREEDEGFLDVSAGGDAVGFGFLQPLSPNKDRFGSSFTYSNEPTEDDSDYWYKLFFVQCHKEEDCTQ